MKKLIAMLIALAVMLSALTVLVSADGDEEYVERELTIYEIETAPKIDGVIEDGEYLLVSSWPLDKEDFISRGDYVQQIEVKYYMCYDENNLYFAVKTVCDGDHVAVMDNDNKRYVFNAHYLMTLIIPDDSARVDDAGKDVYPGQEATWTQLANGNFAYEFTTIYTSEEIVNKEGSKVHDANVPFATDHFMNMTSLMQYCTGHVDGYDIYEISIPWTSMKNGKNTTALTPEVGTVFGFDSTIGLTNVSDIAEVQDNNGYDGIDQADGSTVYYGNYLYFADCYGHGAKDLRHACVVTLGGAAPADPIGGDDESEPESQPEPASEPEQEQEESKEQGHNTPATGDAGIIALAVVSVIALGGAVIVKKSR